MSDVPPEGAGDEKSIETEDAKPLETGDAKPIQPAPVVPLTPEIADPTRVLKRRRVRKKKIQVGPNYDIPGVIRLEIGPTSQRELGIIVGEDVNPEKPWKLISKAGVLENIDIYPNSDFRNIQKEIEALRRDELLVGYAPNDALDYHEFWVCLTDKANDDVVAINEKLAEDRHKKLLNAINKTIFPWESLGSEIEVNDNIVSNTRPLIEVEIESAFPFEQKTRRFAERLSEDIRDGYVELRPTRQTFGIVTRKLVDVAVQSAPTYKDGEAQTVPPYPSNMWTQYEYDCSEQIQEAAELPIKPLADFIANHEEEMEDNIRFNGVLDMYVNDYPILAEKGGAMEELITGDSVKLVDFMCFADIRICKDKLVSRAAWHPMWVGIVAVAYVSHPACMTNVGRSTVDEVNKAVHEKNPVLIWSFNDVLRPKLSLENYREVTALSFCPYNPNILLGGGANGQILIWDLTNRLEKVETDEVLTVAQVKYRTVMFSYMDWMKNVKNDASVRPAAVSNLQYSHYGAVTDIQWLSPYHFITNNGVMTTVGPKDEFQMQFYTSSEDGTVLVWDLSKRASTVQREQMTISRLSKRPSGLLLDVSPYEGLDRVFKPHYKIIVFKPGEDRARTALSSLTIRRQPVKYKQVGPSPPVFNITNRLIYAPIVEEPKQKVKAELYSGCTEGHFMIFTFEGFNFNQGSVVNKEICTVTSIGTIHDGPIIGMNRHPYLPRIILTVGGKIFAIWDETFLNRPLFWKRNTEKLTSGMWSKYKSNILYLTRADGTVEVWDLLYRSHRPAMMQSISGKLLTDISMHRLPLPQNVIGFGDYNGSFRCFFVPRAFQKEDPNDKPMMDEFFMREKSRKTSIKAWETSWMNRNEEILARKKAQEEYENQMRQMEEEEAQKREEQAILDAEEEKKNLKKTDGRGGLTFEEAAEQRWRDMQLAHMQQVLLSKKRLKKSELELQQLPLKLRIEAQKRKQKKQEERFADAEKIYEDQITILFPETVKPKPIPVISGTEEEPEVEEEEPANYLYEFENAQDIALDLIKDNPFVYTFDWKSVLQDGKARRRNIDPSLAAMTIHTDRQEKRKRLRDLGKLRESFTSMTMLGLEEKRMYDINEGEEMSVEITDEGTEI